MPFTPFALRLSLASGVALVLCAMGARAGTTIEKTSYHGWDEAFTINNGIVEAIVVPGIGRIMQFKLSGEESGPFWENRGLDGKSPNPQSAEWINFGGDKTWPSEQSEWAKITPRGWPPPIGFDSVPVEVVKERDALLLRNPVDPSYGIRAERRISLHPSEAEMRVETTYYKIQGAPVRAGVWVITQLKDPERVFLPVEPAPDFALGYNKPDFALGYNKQSGILPAGLAVRGSWLSCTRSSRDSTKIGSAAGDLFWGDAKWLLWIHAPREMSGDFPDKGSSAEIYTNPDPNRYVELETLGPMKMMKPGDSITRVQSYRLYSRAGALEDQVKELLKR